MKSFEQKVKEGTIITFFKGTGWNYFYEKARTGKIRLGRFYANGHINSNFHTTNWGEYEIPTSFENCEFDYENIVRVQC